MDIKDKEIKVIGLNNRKKAIELLILKYEKQLYIYIYSIINDKNETLDILQDTFIKLINEDRIFNLDFNIKAWLYKVATNLSFNLKRKLKNYLKVVLKISEHETLYKEDILKKYIEKIEYNELYIAINKLSVNEKQIILLKYFEDLSYSEIAEVLNIKIGTVMSRLSRAKEKLKEVMKNG